MGSDSCISDTLTQSPASSSSQSVLGGDLSKDDGNGKEVGLNNDTVRYEEEFDSQMLGNLDFETQQLEDPDCQGGFGDSDGEGTDTTLVLEDDECDNTPTSFRKRKDIVLDSDTSVGKCASGSVKRSSMSVCVASSKGFINEAACSVSKIIRDDEEMADTRNPTPVIIGFIDDAKSDHNMNVREGRTTGAHSVAKKLSFEDAPYLNNLPSRDNESTDGAQDASQLAGLSYLDSEEPGEETQNNAWDFVDKLVSVNDLKMSQEAVPEKASDETNFSVLRTKGTQELAKRINIRSPAKDVSIFDWRDIPEDEEARLSSFKRKKTDRNSSCKKKKEGLNLGKRIVSVACSDSSLLLDGPRGVIKGIETSELESNNSFQSDKRLDAVTQEKLPELTAISNDAMDMYDVGFDTQMAAEGMEALLCAPPADHDGDISHQVPEKTIVHSPGGDSEMKSCLKHDLVHKKHCSTDIDAAIRPCKKTKIMEAKSSNEITCHTISGNSRVKQSKPASGVKQRKPTSGVKPKVKGSLKQEGAYAGKNSTKSVGSKKTVAEQEMGSVKRANCLDIYDVGFDTQMAAEGMEALLCAPPADHDDDISHQVSEKTTVHSLKGDSEMKSCLKHDLVHKKHCTTDIDAAVRQCKKMKIMAAKSSNEITCHTVSVKSRVKQRKPASGVKQRKPTSGVKPKVNGSLKREGAYSGNNSTKSIGRKKTVAEQEMGSVKRANCLDNMLESNENVSLNQSLLQEFGTFTPIACRTRRSRAAKPLKGLNLSTNSEDARYLLSGISHSSGKSPDMSVKSQLPKIKKQSQQDNRIPVDQRHQPNTTTEEINFQFVPRRKRSKRRVRVSFNCEMKNDTGSIFISDPSPGKKFGETMAEENLCESGLADGAVNCSTAVVNGNLVPINLGNIKSSEDDGKVSEVFISSNENTEQCNTLDVTSRNFTQHYHRKKSKKTSLLRPSLAKELSRLDSIEVSPNPVVKDLRKRREMANVRVLFSNHLDEDIIKHQQKISGRLGICISSTSSEATHFVADQFARTRNMLEAIAHGKHVVTHLWLESCEQAGCLIDEKNYILRDPKKEKEIRFSMPVSLARARKCPLLQDKQIFVTPNVKPSRELVSDLAKAVRGQVVEEIGRYVKNSNKIPDDLLIFSCEEDRRICMPLVKKGAAIYSSEILLTGIIIQKLEYGRHRLFRDQ
ncbi:hypothetical protein MKW94_025536 [Papaver nudicaule]|uniref:BRCT domain-containing protein n=1 Tax=Papaver nudicaule TaxID=74823 RepID=A0AA41S3T1_PAPNU|nr:hypothetical protein [Papaver nudicaule]